MTQALALASARRPWVTIGAWAVALAAAVLVSFTLLSGALTSEAGFSGSPDSKQATALLEQRLAETNPVDEIVVVRSETLTVDDPASPRRRGDDGAGRLVREQLERERRAVHISRQGPA
jgi:uncharacterized membrane protein YdfJ with MMPL/SSD domain